MDDATAITVLKKDLTWLQKHERLLLAGMVLAVILTLGNMWMNHVARVDHDHAVVAQNIADQQAAANKALAQQVAQQTAMYEQERDARQKEEQLLLAAIATRDAAAAKKAVDVSAPKTAQEAVNDLSMTYTLRKPVVVTADGADVPTEDLQQFTLTKIERDTFQADYADEQKQTAAAQDGQKQAESLVTSLQGQVTGLNVQIQKNDAACVAEKKDLQAQARKSKAKWFIGGFVVGITTRVGAKALAFFSGL